MFKNVKSKWRAVKAALFADDLYDCLKPNGTKKLLKQYEKETELLFDSLVTMTDTNDEVYKKLSYLGFKICEETMDLRTVVPRGQVCPDAMDSNTVETDAMIWMQDKLADIQNWFIRYELAGVIEVYANYDSTKDIVLFIMQPILKNEVNDMQRFITINKFVTVLYYVLGYSVSLTILTVLWKLLA
jgi:hypothetical protein